MPDINERMGKVELQVEEMHHRLFGNGDIGEIARMRKTLHEQAEDIRTLNLETKLSFSSIRADIKGYFMWFCGLVTAVLFLTGNGTISLDSVIHLLMGHK